MCLSFCGDSIPLVNFPRYPEGIIFPWCPFDLKENNDACEIWEYNLLSLKRNSFPDIWNGINDFIKTLPFFGNVFALSFPNGLKVTAELIPYHENVVWCDLLLTGLWLYPKIFQHFFKATVGGGGEGRLSTHKHTGEVQFPSGQISDLVAWVGN